MQSFEYRKDNEQNQTGGCRRWNSHSCGRLLIARGVWIQDGNNLSTTMITSWTRRGCSIMTGSGECEELRWMVDGWLYQNGILSSKSRSEGYTL